jgi:aldose sugar dehydrogenase
MGMRRPRLSGLRRVRHAPTWRSLWWKRNAFVAGLREGGIPRTGQVQRIVFNERWEELRREPLLAQLKQRIRDIRQGPDDLLYVLTAEEKGALLRLEPDL